MQTSIRQHIDLIESLTYVSLLTESERVTFLLKTYGDRLEQKFQAGRADEPPAVLHGIEEQPGQNDREKLLSFLMAHDPTRNNAFTQWLVNRYLRGDFRLEDAERAFQYLEVFQRAKPRLAVKDINQYRTLADLYQAIAPFMESDEPVSQRQADVRLDRRMHQEDQAEVLFDDETLKVLVPKTETAAIYFGRNTQWCTAGSTSTNYFNHYNQDGPLYIILFKKDNRRFQFHFPSRQFMDERDHQCNLAAVIGADPRLLRIIGEQQFLPFAERIGLQYFSPKAVRGLTAVKMAQMIQTAEDLENVPEDIRSSLEFISHVINRNPGRIAWFPAEVIRPHLEEFVRQDGRVVGYVPAEMLTQELVDLAMGRGNWTADAILSAIPEHLRSPTVLRTYWEVWVNKNYRARLGEVPEEYRTPEIIYTTLERNPDDIQKFGDVLTPEIALRLVQRNVNNVIRLPDHVLSQEIADRIRNDAVSGYNTDLTKQFLRMPTEWWDQKITDKLIRGQHIGIDAVPRQFLNAENAQMLVQRRPADITKVPAEMLTREFLVKAIADKHEILDHVDPSLVDDTLLAEVAGKMIIPEWLVKHLTRPEWRTDRVMQALIDKAALPIAEMPRRLITPEAVLTRLGKSHHGKGSEFPDIPPAMLTPAFAVEIYLKDSDLIDEFPVSLLSEDLLNAVLTGRRFHNHYGMGYHGSDTPQKLQAITRRFPDSCWSARNVAEAILRHVLPAEIGAAKGQMDEQVARELLRRNPQLITTIPAAVVTPNVLTYVAGNNLDIFDLLPPERVTEPMVHAAMTTYASHSYGDTQERLRKLPRKLWSERVWAVAVGHIVDLGEVPKRYRTEDVIRTALNRDVSNVHFLPDAPGWLNQHFGKSPDKEWLKRLDAEGIAYVKRKFVGAGDFEAEPLAGGWSVRIAQQGPTGRRFYLYDPKGQYRVNFHTKGSVVELPSPPKAEPFRDQILEIARRHLQGYTTAQLNHIGIYSNHRETEFYTEDTVPRTKIGDIEMSEVSHLNGTRYTLWADNKPILRAFAASGSGWNSRNVTVKDFDILDRQAVMRHDQSVIKAMSKFMEGSWYGLRPCGIGYTKGKGYFCYRQQPLGELGGFQIFMTDDRRLSLFLPKDGMVATAVLRKNGSLDKIETDYDYRDRNNTARADVERVLDAIAAKLTVAAKPTPKKRNKAE
jgi:hypothetical protein